MLDTDLVTLITNTADPEQSLHLYMSDLQYTIRQQSTNQHLLIERRNDELARERHCLSQKQVSDDDFFQSVQQGLSDDMLVAIADDSAAMGACAEQARVKARAYQVMIQKIDTYRQQLQERFTLLRNNESFILQHYSLATTDPAIMSQMNRLIHALDE
ncbi:MAG: hypothetical protein H6766_00260 [Candidatus Peribacteria bacterium]|nr:MAG: hypothetical protein H6766_00260 [Candidatus Peribacteria bacterium]